MIDVIIPCFNAEKTLMRAVESVLAQPELGTLWLIDDASTDGSIEIIQKITNKNLPIKRNKKHRKYRRNL